MMVDCFRTIHVKIDANGKEIYRKELNGSS